MADARDFPPLADPPTAEKSTKQRCSVKPEGGLKPNPGVYVLLGGDGVYMYKGSARDLRKRISDHGQGRVARTRNLRPLQLIHFEYTVDYTEARRRENWLKSGQGRQWLKTNFARVAKWQTQGTFRLWRIRLRRKNPQSSVAA
jgi:putative endonuclease